LPDGGFSTRTRRYEVANQIEVTTRRGVERVFAMRLNMPAVWAEERDAGGQDERAAVRTQFCAARLEAVKADYKGIETDYHHGRCVHDVHGEQAEDLRCDCDDEYVGDIITDPGRGHSGRDGDGG